ncbi:MAG: hypothetical protein MUF16_06610 [Burkholderiaceae bacterium]|nr:hypothetical protein [Burkholderiaceae bacterium]
MAAIGMCAQRSRIACSAGVCAPTIASEEGQVRKLGALLEPDDQVDDAQGQAGGGHHGPEELDPIRMHAKDDHISCGCYARLVIGSPWPGCGAKVVAAFSQRSAGPNLASVHRGNSYTLRIAQRRAASEPIGNTGSDALCA